MNVGETAIIARYYGAKKYKNISLVLKHVMLLPMLGFVLPISVLMIVLAPYVLSFLGADAPVIEVGTSYFRVIMLGFIFQSFSFTMTAALRGIAETKILMRNNVIVGVQVAGVNASDIIAELGLAVEAGMNAEDIALTIHSHPSLSEVVMDTAELALGMPIHV